VITIVWPFCALTISEISFRDHRNGFARAFCGTDAAAFAVGKVCLVMVAFISHALWGTVKGTEPAVIALFYIQHRAFRPPASRIQAKENLVRIGPGAFRLENILMFDYHLITSTSR
jgi:hypothetical protein